MSTSSDFSIRLDQFRDVYRKGVDVNLCTDICGVNNVLSPRVDGVRGQAVPESVGLSGVLQDCLIRCGIGSLKAAHFENCSLHSGLRDVPAILKAICSTAPAGLVLVPEAMPAQDRAAIESTGHRTLPVPEDQGGIRLDGINSVLDQQGEDAATLRFVVIPVINKVTGTLLENMRKQIIAASLAGKATDSPVRIIYDNSFIDLVHYEKAEHPVMAITNNPAENVIEIGSVSDVMVPGTRVGWVLTHSLTMEKDLQSALCAPDVQSTPEDVAIAASILPHITPETLEGIHRDYRIASVAVMRSLKTYFGGTLSECHGGHAGFHFLAIMASTSTATGSSFETFLSRRTGEESIDTVALESGKRVTAPLVLYLPGRECFHPLSPHQEGIADRVMRISYGYEDVGALQKGVQIMRQAIEYDLALRKA